jgi:hypothetical protein
LQPALGRKHANATCQDALLDGMNAGQTQMTFLHRTHKGFLVIAESPRKCAFLRYRPDI